MTGNARKVGEDVMIGPAVVSSTFVKASVRHGLMMCGVRTEVVLPLPREGHDPVTLAVFEDMFPRKRTTWELRSMDTKEERVRYVRENLSSIISSYVAKAESSLDAVKQSALALSKTEEFSNVRLS